MTDQLRRRSMVDHQTHNLEVSGSTPGGATKYTKEGNPHAFSTPVKAQSEPAMRGGS